jgi:hypothetical protein
MPIESATYIKDLEPTNPTATDSLADSDNHIRLIKAALKTTFPNLDGVVSGQATNLNAYVPIGGIIMWSGAIGSIPAGWVLCQGQTGLTRSDGGGTINAPNLLDRFIVGAGSNYAIGNVGGSVLHSHSVSVGAHSLSWNEMPPHNHGVNDPGHGHVLHDPGHSHSYSDVGIDVPGFGAAGGSQIAFNAHGVTTGASGTGMWLDGALTGISTQNAGSGWGHDHPASAGNSDGRPPYYALAFIMRI